MTPNIKGYKHIEDPTKQNICDYLNAVLEKYGPPCDFCKHFTIICYKDHRPRRYTLKLGPFDHWDMRKKCNDFIEKDDDGSEKASGITLQNWTIGSCGQYFVKFTPVHPGEMSSLVRARQLL